MTKRAHPRAANRALQHGRHSERTYHGEVVTLKDGDAEHICGARLVRASAKLACVSVHGANRLGSNSLARSWWCSAAHQPIALRGLILTRIRVTTVPMSITAGRDQKVHRLRFDKHTPRRRRHRQRRSCACRCRRSCRSNAAVFPHRREPRGGQTSSSARCGSSFCGCQGVRPEHGLEHRPRRDRRARQPAPSGAGRHHSFTARRTASKNLEADTPVRTSRIVTTPKWMKHTLVWQSELEAQPVIDYRPVHDYTLTDEVEYIKPKKRVY